MIPFKPRGPLFERGAGNLTAVFDVREAAAFLGITAGTVYRLTRAGELPHVRIGRSIRFRIVDLDDYLADKSRAAFVAQGWKPRTS